VSAALHSIRQQAGAVDKVSKAAGTGMVSRIGFQNVNKLLLGKQARDISKVKINFFTEN